MKCEGLLQPFIDLNTGLVWVILKRISRAARNEFVVAIVRVHWRALNFLISHLVRMNGAQTEHPYSKIRSIVADV